MRRWRGAVPTTAGIAGAVALATASLVATSPAAVGSSPTWKVVPAPSVAGAVDLTGVVAFGPSDAWAVGYVEDAGGVRTLTLHWDGSSWTRVKSPNPGAERNWLTSVSGSSPTDVWAVGSYVNRAGQRQSLVMHWDGSQWAAAPSPSINYENVLNGVEVLSPTDAWAVGSALDVGFTGRTLILRWNGSAWTVVPSPSPSTSGVGSNLLDVTAAAANDVWAVGNVDTGDYAMGPLIEHWDGKGWTAQSLPAHPEEALVGKVGADPSGGVWAVGWRRAGELTQPLAMRWTGTDWAVAGSPSFDRDAAFAGVAVLASGEVWAVGDRGSRTLAARWDGTSWTVTPSANPGRMANNLVDVAVVPGTNCLWAVGSYLDTGALSRALIEHHC